MISSQRTLATALLIAASSVCAGAQPQNASEKGAGAKSTGKHYVLPANKDTVQWGWLDPTEKPKVVVDSGDTVSIETLRHSMDVPASSSPPSVCWPPNFPKATCSISSSTRKR